MHLERTITVDTSVDIDIYDIIDEMKDEELSALFLDLMAEKKLVVPANFDLCAVVEILKAAGCPEDVWRPVERWVRQPVLKQEHLEAWRRQAVPA